MTKRNFYFAYYKEKCPHCIDNTQMPVMRYGLMQRQSGEPLAYNVIDKFCMNCWPETFEWFKAEAEKGTIKIYMHYGHGDLRDHPDTILVLYKYMRDKFPRTIYPKSFP